MHREVGHKYEPISKPPSQPLTGQQVAVERTKPNGRIVGIDIIPAQPPKGVSTIQGNFLAPSVQAEVKRFLLDPKHGRVKPQFASLPSTESYAQNSVIEDAQSYVDIERHAEDDVREGEGKEGKKAAEERMVDVVLSDMSAPFEQTAGFWKRSLSDPYHRMMNTSGIPFRDHAGSMVCYIILLDDIGSHWLTTEQDLCAAALQFARETLKVGGHFVCKFYQGAEDKDLEVQLKAMFKVVHREKPESSRSVS
jgi:21S rRNA (uridine2791-2'-O)-methyltransferase